MLRLNSSFSQDKKTVFIVAGEASGDLHGANLIKALKRRIPEIRVAGIGGPRMREAGLYCLYKAEKMAVVGLTEVVFHLKDVWLARQRAKAFLKKVQPKVFIPIDYPDFNFHLASFAKQLNIPVVYYISPQVWAWRRGRVRKMAQFVDKVAAILPFEEEFYARYGIDVTFVGHPLLDVIPETSTLETEQITTSEIASPLIGLLPGSRKSEVEHLLPLMLKTASIIYQKRPELKFILPVASTLSLNWLKGFVSKLIQSSSNFFDIPLELYKPSSLIEQYRVMQKCAFLLVASGTATLETAILERPFVIIYRLSNLSYFLGRILVSVPYIGLVNWVAGEKIIPEFIQSEARPEVIAQYVLATMEDFTKIEHITKRLRTLRHRLGKSGVADRVASMIMEFIEQ